jgi:hypothetical protein
MKLYASRLDDAPFGDAPGILVNEKGHVLVTHISSSLGWARIDLLRHADRLGYESFEFLDDRDPRFPMECIGCDDPECHKKTKEANNE